MEVHMEVMSALYLTFMLITVLFMGITYLLGKRKFGPGSNYLLSLLASLKSYLRIISILGLLSLLLINSERIAANFIPFLCIPFFVLNTAVFSTYFRLSSHHSMTNGKK